MDSSEGDVAGDDSNKLEDTRAVKVLDLSPRGFDSVPTILWRCTWCDGYFLRVVSPIFGPESDLDEILDAFQQAILDFPDDRDRAEDADDKFVLPPMPLNEPVLGLIMPPYDEVDRAADRLVESTPCTCEFNGTSHE